MVEKQNRKSVASDHSSDSNKTRLPFGAPDPSSMASAQQEAAQAFAELFGLTTHASVELAKRQTDFFKKNQELFRAALEDGRDREPAARIARQGELYGEFMDASVKHMAGMMEIVSTCCCKAVERTTKLGADYVAAAGEKTTD